MINTQNYNIIKNALSNCCGALCDTRNEALQALNQSTVHWNDAGVLPPVGCWLHIEYAGEVLKVRRLGYLLEKNGAWEMETEDGRKIEGRYRWRY